MAKQITSNYWDVTSVDMYVRGSDTTAAVADFNNSIKNNGNDWFEYEKDSEKSDNHLCTKADEDGFKCKKIKCILRREMTTADADDIQFEPADLSNVKMVLPAGKSYILMN